MHADRPDHFKMLKLFAGGSRVCAALLGVAALAACSEGHDNQQQAARKTAIVAQPTAATVTRYLYETGTAKALNSVDLVARVSGILKSIDYKDGTEVKAGQRLFLIEPDQYMASEQQSEASVQQAQATLENAQRQLDRQNQLSRQNVTTAADVDNARTTRDTSQAQLTSAEASLALAKLNLSYTTVTAPFDGFVTDHQADVGALVGASGPTTLATIVQLDPIQISFSVSDTDMLQIRQQMRKKNITFKDISNIPVEMGTQIDNGYPYKGKLDYAAPQTATDTGTLSARAILPNPDRALLPGLFLRIRIPIETVKDALLVPPSAVGTDQEGRYVLVVDDKGAVERRSVRLLERTDGQQQIEGSVSATDWVIQNVLSGAQAGDTVTKQQSASAQSTASTPDAGKAPQQSAPASSAN